MATRINGALRNVVRDAIIDEFDGGIARCYTGAQPASAGDAASGTLLGEINPLPTPALATNGDGVLQKAGDWTTEADDDGVAGYWRLISAAGDRRMDLAVGAEVTMSNVNIVAGGDLTADTVAITVAASV